MQKNSKFMTDQWWSFAWSVLCAPIVGSMVGGQGLSTKGILTWWHWQQFIVFDIGKGRFCQGNRFREVDKGIQVDRGNDILEVCVVHRQTFWDRLSDQDREGLVGSNSFFSHGE